MNTNDEYLLAFVVAIDKLLDELKIKNPKERGRLRNIVAKSMGQTLGEITIKKIEQDIKNNQDVKSESKNKR